MFSSKEEPKMSRKVLRRSGTESDLKGAGDKSSPIRVYDSDEDEGDKANPMRLCDSPPNQTPSKRRRVEESDVEEGDVEEGDAFLKDPLSNPDRLWGALRGLVAANHNGNYHTTSTQPSVAWGCTDGITACRFRVLRLYGLSQSRSDRAISPYIPSGAASSRATPK